MIILDSNVVSEPLKPLPNSDVLQWLVANSGRGLFLTAVSVAELMSGAALLPDGARKRRLIQRLEETISDLFRDRMLSFDRNAAFAYAEIHASAKRSGRVMGYPDCQIAAIAKTNGFAVATRDVQPFADAGLQVINPWTDQ